MTQFTTHTIETAPEGSRPFLKGAKETYAFVPNLLGTMAVSPALLEGYMTLADIFDKTELAETERQIILMTNNHLNGCSYCMAAHTTISQMAKVPFEVIDSLEPLIKGHPGKGLTNVEGLTVAVEVAVIILGKSTAR